MPLIGWAGTQNGALLRRAVEDGFAVLVTMDGRMLHQQNIGRLALAIVALRAPTNRLADTRPLMARLLNLLPQLQPGTLTFVSADE